MAETPKELGEFNLKVLIKTMVVTHQHFIASLIDRNLYYTLVTEIASRLKESVDRVERALERLEQDGWLVCEEAPGEDKKVKLTLKGWNVYGSFEIVYPERGSPESLQIKYSGEAGKLAFCKEVVNCFYRVLKERYGEEYREVMTGN